MHAVHCILSFRYWSGIYFIKWSFRNRC